MNALTQTQFETAQDKVDQLARASRKGTPEQQESYRRIHAAWETAIALPQRTFDERADRLTAIASVAAEYGLVLL